MLRMGVEPTRTTLSTLRLCQFAYPSMVEEKGLEPSVRILQGSAAPCATPMGASARLTSVEHLRAWSLLAAVCTGLRLTRLWSCGESNPDLDHAMVMCCRYHYSPIASVVAGDRIRTCH